MGRNLKIYLKHTLWFFNKFDKREKGEANDSNIKYKNLTTIGETF